MNLVLSLMVAAACPAGHPSDPDAETLAGFLSAEYARLPNLRAHVELTQWMADGRVFRFDADWVVQGEKKWLEFRCDALSHMSLAFAFNGWHSEVQHSGVRPQRITLTAVDEYPNLPLFARYTHPLLCFLSDRGQEWFAAAPPGSFGEWQIAPPEIVNGVTCVPLVLRVKTDLTEYRHRPVSTAMIEQIEVVAGEPLQTYWLDPAARYLPRRIQRHSTLDQAELLIDQIQYQQVGEFVLPLSAVIVQGTANAGTWYSQATQVLSVAEPQIPDTDFVLPKRDGVILERNIGQGEMTRVTTISVDHDRIAERAMDQVQKEIRATQAEQFSSESHSPIVFEGLAALSCAGCALVGFAWGRGRMRTRCFSR